MEGVERRKNSEREGGREGQGGNEGHQRRRKEKAKEMGERCKRRGGERGGTTRGRGLPQPHISPSPPPMSPAPPQARFTGWLQGTARQVRSHRKRGEDRSLLGFCERYCLVAGTKHSISNNNNLPFFFFLIKFPLSLWLSLISF